jgi:uncharacterized cupin superfamily protein
MNDPKRITVLRQSALLSGLQDQGTPANPKSEPPCRFSGIDVALAGAGDNACGIWECTPGRFMRQLAEAEVMHILAGRGRFTPIAVRPREHDRRMAHRGDVAQGLRRDGSALTRRTLLQRRSDRGRRDSVLREGRHDLLQRRDEAVELGLQRVDVR